MDLSMTYRFLMYFVKQLCVVIASCLLHVAASSHAFAGELVYTPVNPAFGGSSFNKDFLLGTAEAQNKPKRKDAKKNDPFNKDPLTEFTTTLQSRLLSSLADKITQSIYGAGSPDRGIFTVDNTTVTYQKVGGIIQLTLSDGIRSTQISLPAN